MPVAPKFVISPKAPIVLSAGVEFVSPKVPIPALTDRIELRLRRPTTLLPLAWPATAELRVRLIITADGVAHVFQGSASGGIRLSKDGKELPFYVLRASSTWGFFGATEGFPKRLGQGKGLFTAHIEITALSGSVMSEVEVDGDESPAPQVPFHSSVAFDAVTSAQELSGDGVLSLTHTATGADRAAFAGVGIIASNTEQNSTSVSYGGIGMTEMWDTPAVQNTGAAGYRLAAPATGAQTVTSTIQDATPFTHFLGLISMTGVDQTTPVGTPVSATGTDTAPTVTVASVGADDLVVDNLMVGGSLGTVTIGADQTERWSQSEGPNTGEGRGSTQLGTAGGVMSWTLGATPVDAWAIGAVAFKPVAAAAAAGFGPLFAGQRNRHVLSARA